MMVPGSGRKLDEWLAARTLIPASRALPRPGGARAVVAAAGGRGGRGGRARHFGAGLGTTGPGAVNSGHLLITYSGQQKTDRLHAAIA